MSIAMSVLAILEEGPTYGLRLKNAFEDRTAQMWPLNVGQVYSTLRRLERDGLVHGLEEGPEARKRYEITPAGRDALRSWFDTPTRMLPPARDELVLKLVMAVDRDGVHLAEVIQAERRGAVETLQELTLMKRDGSADSDLGWALLLDSLIFQTEARVRWLDDSEARLARHLSAGTAARAHRPVPEAEEVRR
ncbi:MAG TPA: PadR family transcriptional regulator [Actinomycetota bacterium]|jgi:DNA-binding PadR family transcriptional regulator